MSQSSERDAPSRAADELLVVRCQLGEPDAFDALIAQWHHPLWIYIRRMIGRDEDAQNILQDVWLRAIRGIPRLRDGSRLRGWSFGITRRVLMDRLRRRYAMPTPSALDGEDLPSDPEPIDSESGASELTQIQFLRGLSFTRSRNQQLADWICRHRAEESNRSCAGSE